MENWKTKVSQKYSLTDAELAALLSVGQMERYPAGTDIIRMGMLDDNYYVMVQGVCREYCYRKGEEVTVRFDVQGDLFYSAASCVAHRPSMLYVEAVTPVEVLRIAGDKLKTLWASSLSGALFWQRILQRAVCQQEERHIANWQKTAQEKYADLLSCQSEIVRTVPLKYIASYLGITAQSLSRIRSSYRSR